MGGQDLTRRRSKAKRDPLPEYVAGAKGGPWYTAHTYPTKVPPEAIVPFIEASTDEDGLVADPFCGSGMTGVAALLAGREAVLSDLSPGAVHLARNHTHRVDPEKLAAAVAGLDARWMLRLEQDLYGTEIAVDGLGDVTGTTRHTVWSEVYPCPSCNHPVVLWDVAEPDRPLTKGVQCDVCRALFDRTTVRPVGSVPAHVVVKPSFGGKLVGGELTEAGQAKLDQIAGKRLRHWFPKDPIDAHREMYIRSALHLRNVRTVADMFARRPKLALSRLWHELNCLEDAESREALQFAFTNTAWHSSRMRRYNARGGQRPLTGTLFIPQLQSEPNVFEVFRHQVKQVARLYDVLPDGDVKVRRGSATALTWMADRSVDYVFTDPPFGNNIHYADCNIVWESWLGEVTDNDAEIVTNKSRSVDHGGKTVDDYQRLLAEAFSEARRIVAVNGRVSVVFHNSDDAVWGALLDAVEAAGLHQAEVSILDKGQRSQKGYKVRRGELVPFYDLVMTFTPAVKSVPRLNGAGDVALGIVTDHLTSLNGNDLPARRNLDYLYSVAVGGVIRSGRRPTGLSLRAFEKLCESHLRRVGECFYLPGK